MEHSRVDLSNVSLGLIRLPTVRDDLKIFIPEDGIRSKLAAEEKTCM